MWFFRYCPATRKEGAVIMVRVWLHADRAYAGAPITNTVSLYMGSEGGASDTHGGLCVDEARSCLVTRWTRMRLKISEGKKER